MMYSVPLGGPNRITSIARSPNFFLCELSVTPKSNCIIPSLLVAILQINGNIYHRVCACARVHECVSVYARVCACM